MGDEEDYCEDMTIEEELISVTVNYDGRLLTSLSFEGNLGTKYDFGQTIRTG